MNIRENYDHTIYASYLGYITQAIVNNLAPLLFLIFREEFGFSLQEITLITTLNFAVQLTVDLLAAKFIDRIGYRTGVLAAHVFSAAGLILMAILPGAMAAHYAGLITAVVLYAIGGGLIEVLISPIVEACPTDHKASAMSLLHSFYCWGTVAVVLFSTLFLLAAGKGNWRILCYFWALVPIFNFFYFLLVPINTLTAENEGMSIRELVGSGTFWIFFVLMITAGASEQGMSQWASAFAESGLHVSKTMGDIMGPCFFSILMGASRAFYGKKGEKIDLMRFIRLSAVLCIFSYLLAVFAPHPLLSLLGCGLCGLSVGIFWPGTFSLASARMPKGGTAMFALLALAGDVGCSSGPTVVGFAADLLHENLRLGLLGAVIFPVVLLVFSGLLKKRNA